MADAKTRARNILNALPLSTRQRAIYERGVAAMDEATLERTTSKLESALSRAPETLAAARELLANQQAQTRKRAVVFVEDEEYRQVLTGMLGEKLEIETPHTPEEAIRTIRRTYPDVVICDFQMPRMRGLGLIERMRRAASPACTILVRTANPEQDGQVAAAGATGYPASNTATELTTAVTSAIEAGAGLSAQSGGHRVDEIEAWATEAGAAAQILQKLLTATSDDAYGRAKIYEAIVKGEAGKPGVPDSFNLLIRELQSLRLDVDLMKKAQHQAPDIAPAAD
jgi:DNA-binding NarL/FixJ family response regulator